MLEGRQAEREALQPVQMLSGTSHCSVVAPVARQFHASVNRRQGAEVRPQSKISEGVVRFSGAAGEALDLRSGDMLCILVVDACSCCWYRGRCALGFGSANRDA